jgi:hypothetical protein
MAGMKMKNRNGPNPGEELFYKLSLKAGFQNDLEKARRLLQIPKDGFTNEDEHFLWQCSPGKPKLSFAVIFRLREKYKIPISYLHLLSSYLHFGEARAVTQEKQDVLSVLPPAHLLEPGSFDLESYYREHNEPYVRLIILGNGTKSAVLKSIDDNWGEIEAMLKGQGVTRPKRVRETKYKKRNKRIKELWRKTKKELGNENATYKDSLIRAILKREGFGDVDDGYIRKIGSE